MHFLITSNKLKITTFLTIVFCIAISFSFTEKKSAVENTRAFSLQEAKEFSAQLDTFQSLLQNHFSKEEAIQRFKNVRIAFKQTEFLIEYISSQQYAFFNGVNAVEMDEGYNPNAKPEGLQVVEQELFADSIDVDRILFLTKQLKYRTLSYHLYFNEVELKDTYIFEALRYHLIRMEALNLVSFDSPDLRNNCAEIRAALLAMAQVLSFYKDETNQKEVEKINLTLQAAAKYIGTKNFTTLDRLFFIKNYIQPISQQLLMFQQKNKIPFSDESTVFFRATNLRSKTIYDADFLNPKAYAQDKYYADKPELAQIGKKLFTDKRLSIDNKLSCATCHQVANAFTDKEFTAITNVDGKFQKRNTPTLLNAALQAGFFYDIRALSLEQQIGHVITNTEEFNCTYDTIVYRLKSDTQYVRLFSQAFPEYKDDAITSYTINTCLADFQRKLILLNSPFDKYMRNETAIISESTKRGFNLFMGKAQCGSCHFAPTYFGLTPPFYSNSEAEILGVTKKFDTIHPVLDDDIGRFKVFEFDDFKHAFKTSTVRNSFLTAPYFHNGGFLTLPDVIEFYNQGGAVGMGLDVPNQTLPETKLKLTGQDKKDLISFIKALTDTSGVAKLMLNN
ncbi:MAG: cytochrome c peroxidase [Chitinophagales bacterium]